MSDIELLEILEDKLNMHFERLALDIFLIRDGKYYVESNEGEIIALSIDNANVNEITSEIYKFKNLKYLRMFGNSIYSVPKEIELLKELIFINLNHNCIEEFPTSFLVLPQLREIYLNSNRIKSIPPKLNLIQNFECLDLSYNQITQIPSYVFNLKARVIVDNINYLDRAIIDVYKNPISDPPLEVIRSGSKLINEYFNSRNEYEKEDINIKRSNEIKAILVGEADAGKSSIVNRLVDDMYDSNEAITHSINVKPWIFECNSEEIKVNFWDFGGQDIMHATNQFFMTERAVYILVIDGRKNLNIVNWLKMIESFGGDSPIVLVENKIDHVNTELFSYEELKSKYKGLRSDTYCRISCLTGEGFEGLKKSICEAIQHVEIKSFTLPESWNQVKQHLESLRLDNIQTIKESEFKEICKKFSVVDDGESYILELFHQMGVLLHFNDFNLKGLKILDPNWATSGIYNILSSSEINEQNGILNVKSIESIVNIKQQPRYQYSYEDQYYLVHLMQKFELCFPITEDLYLIPTLLKSWEPIYHFDYSECLTLFVEYSFLPISVLPRLMVALHEDIINEDGTDLRWRNGFVVKDRYLDTKAEIKSDYYDNRISIRISGFEKRFYLAQILNDLRRINNGFMKIKIAEKIEIPDRRNILVSLDHLLVLEKQGVDSFIPEGCSNSYKVHELLGTVRPNNSVEDYSEVLRRLIKDNDDKKSISEKMLRALGTSIDLVHFASNLKTILNLYL